MPFTCQSLRTIVSLAALLFVIGMLLQAPPLLLPANAIFPSAIISFVGLLAMALAMLIVLLTAAVTLFPNVRKRLSLCQH
jgi:hypothetical protein